MGIDSIEKSIAKCIQYQNTWMATASWIMSDISENDAMEKDDVKYAAGLFSDVVRHSSDVIASLNKLMEHMGAVGRKLEAKAAAGKGEEDGNDCD